MYSNNYWYWLGTPYRDFDKYIWSVYQDGSVYFEAVGGISGGRSNGYNGVVRPVIVLSKTALGDVDEAIIDKSNNNNIMNSDNIKIITVKVDNTYMSKSIMSIICGFIIAGICVFILYKLSNKKKK